MTENFFWPKLGDFVSRHKYRGKEIGFVQSAESVINRALKQIDRSELVNLGCDLVNIPSPPGHERKIAEYILGFFESLGLETTKQELGEDRWNAIGVIRGKGDGASISFNGHMDTSFTGTPEDLLWVRKEVASTPEFQPKAFVKDDHIYGLGIANMKAGLTAMLTAAKALKKSEINLKGDVYFTGVAGETGRAPVDEYWGQQYEAGGYGSRYMVSRGMVSDYAVCCDGSNMKLTWVQTGVAYLKVTTYGKAVYVPFVNRDWNKRQSISALSKMVPIINAIEDWSADYETKNSREWDGLLVSPHVCIGCIRAGVPYRPSLTPGFCNIYIDVRTPPDITPLSILDEVRRLVRQVDPTADVSMYRSQMGHIAKDAGVLIDTVEKAFKDVCDKPIEKATAAYNSMWTDTNVYNEIGIPCVKIGPSPSDIGEERKYGAMPIEDILNAAKLYTITAIRMTDNPKRKHQSQNPRKS